MCVEAVGTCVKQVSKVCSDLVVQKIIGLAWTCHGHLAENVEAETVIKVRSFHAS